MALTKYKLGELIELCDERNANETYSLESVKGISIQKTFIETKADMEDVSLRPYILVKPDYFAYVPTTSRNGNKITIAHNTSSQTCIVSSSYIVFSVIKPKVLLSDYLFMYFNRPEFDRYSRFHSWGSARETFDWDAMCDMDIELPPIEVQQKYVDIYNAMLANQKAYEKGLDDLKLVCDAMIDEIKHKSGYISIEKLVKEVDYRNTNGKIKDIKGINIFKTFMPSVASVGEESVRAYKIVQKGQFAFSGMQTGRDLCIRMALHKENEPIIISPAYTVFEMKTDEMLAEFFMLWFSRNEIDRYGWFVSDGSIRANLDMDRFYEMQIPIPDITVQQSIVDIYNQYITRKEINEKLKLQIKDLCPILIKGSLQKA